MYLKNIYNNYIGILLDAIEEVVGDSPAWPKLRARILKILGDRGFGRYLENEEKESC